MKHTWILGLLLVALLAGCKQARTSEDDDEEIALSEVPANVMAAAEKAVPGITFTSAEKETEDGVVIYEFEGTVNGKEYEVEVTAAGEVIEVEDDGDDDDDDDKGR